nr:MFS transporter [Rhizobium sp. SEMIA 4085]
MDAFLDLMAERPRALSRGGTRYWSLQRYLQTPSHRAESYRKRPGRTIFYLTTASHLRTKHQGAPSASAHHSHRACLGRRPNSHP